MKKSSDLLELCVSANVRIASPQIESLICSAADAANPLPGIACHYYRFLNKYCEIYKPTLMVELGTDTGISAACMAEGNPAGRVITVNYQDQLLGHARRPNVNYVITDSLKKLDLVCPIDLLFIDTDHDGVRCLNEFELYKDSMADDSVILFDDILLGDQMIKFWERLNPDGWEKIKLPIHGNAGFGALIKK